MAESSKQESERSACIEKMLEEMRPIAPSERFFNAVEAQLKKSKSAGNTIRMPRGGLHAWRFPVRRAAVSAAIVLSAVGAGVWGYHSSFSAGGNRNAGTVAADVASSGVAFALASNPVAGGGEPATGRALRSRGNYRLVNVERTISSVMPTVVEVLDSGNLSREIHYSYVDEYSWENQETGMACVELRPNKSVVSMELPVY